MSTTSTFLLAALVSAVIGYFVRFLILKRQIPTAPKIWLIASMIQNRFSMRLVSQKIRKNHPDIAYTEHQGAVMCFLFKPEWIKIVLANSNNRALMEPVASEGLGVKGLAMVTGSTWAVHRKIIAPCLQAHSLKQFHEYVERSVQRAVDRISIQLEHSGEKKVKLDMYTLFKKLSLDTVGYIVTGEPLDSLYDRPDSVVLQKELDFLFEEVLNRSVSPVQYWKLFPFLPQVKRVKAVHKRLRDVAEEAAAKKKLNLKDTTPLTALLKNNIENPECPSDVEVIDETISLMLGGAETIANALCCLFYCFGVEPNVLRKVRDEINNFHKPVIGVEDIKQFTYLECTVKEMLRMYPTVFMVDREATEEIKLGPHTLPKGVKILMPPVAVHYNEEFFPDPWHFNPDRFSNGEPQGYFPFGGGYVPMIATSFSSTLNALA
jgi:cytochrome P450